MVQSGASETNPPADNRQPLSQSQKNTAGKDSEHPLRIVMVVPPYYEVPPRDYGGVEWAVANLIDALVARGHDVTLLGAGNPDTPARFIPVLENPMADRLGEQLPEIVYAAQVRQALRNLVARHRVDVVHDHTIAGPLNAIANAAMGMPTVVTTHCPIDDDRYNIYRAIGDEIRLVAVSERQQQLAPDLPWTGMVHNAIPVATFPFQTDKSNYALFLGRLHPEKAPHLALDAAHACGMPVVLAGKCSEPIEKEYFEREVQPRLRTGDEVFGMADSIAKRKLLADARCLLFPVQWEEPFGMVMIEAMACGTPVIALRRGAVPEVVVDGTTGFICDDPGEFPDAIRKLDRIDPVACRRWVEDRFDLGYMSAAYEAVYLKVLGERDKASAYVISEPDAVAA